jgi:ribonuclease D
MPSPGKPFSVRLDAEAIDALETVAQGRMTHGEAIRIALLEAAQSRRDLAEAIRTAAADPADRDEMRRIRELMDDLAAPWPD